MIKTDKKKLYNVNLNYMIAITYLTPKNFPNYKKENFLVKNRLDNSSPIIKLNILLFYIFFFYNTLWQRYFVT
jgi:hypothetical protein